MAYYNNNNLLSPFKFYLADYLLSKESIGAIDYKVSELDFDLYEIISGVKFTIIKVKLQYVPDIFLEFETDPFSINGFVDEMENIEFDVPYLEFKRILLKYQKEICQINNG